MLIFNNKISNIILTLYLVGMSFLFSTTHILVSEVSFCLGLFINFQITYLLCIFLHFVDDRMVHILRNYLIRKV